LREVREESGIVAQAPRYVPLSRGVPLFADARYEAGASAAIRSRSQEMLEVRWFGLEQIREGTALGFREPRVAGPVG